MIKSLRKPRAKTPGPVVEAKPGAPAPVASVPPDPAVPDVQKPVIHAVKDVVLARLAPKPRKRQRKA